MSSPAVLGKAITLPMSWSNPTRWNSHTLLLATAPGSFLQFGNHECCLGCLRLGQNHPPTHPTSRLPPWWCTRLCQTSSTSRAWPSQMPLSDWHACPSMSSQPCLGEWTTHSFGMSPQTYSSLRRAASLSTEPWLPPLRRTRLGKLRGVVQKRIVGYRGMAFLRQMRGQIPFKKKQMWLRGYSETYRILLGFRRFSMLFWPWTKIMWHGKVNHTISHPPDLIGGFRIPPGRVADAMLRPPTALWWALACAVISTWYNLMDDNMMITCGSTRKSQTSQKISGIYGCVPWWNTYEYLRYEWTLFGIAGISGLSAAKMSAG